MVCIFSSLFDGDDARWAKTFNQIVSFNVSKIGNNTKIRANFQINKRDNKGAIMEVIQVEDEEFYQEFFAKVDKAIYLQKQNI